MLMLIILAGSPCRQADSAETMDLAAAIKIGNGKKLVIEFTDPDCPYCRKAAAYFHNRQDITRFVFLKPLPMHPEAKGKAQAILSAADPVKAYEDTMQGRYDGVKPPPVSNRGGQLLERHLAIATQNRVKSTPTFMIFGRIIEGFDLQKIDGLLR